MFYLILKKLSKRQWLAIAGTAIYVMQPSLAYYEKCILTEALAVDMMVVWIYLLICFLEKRTKNRAFGMGIYSLIMVLMRPSFVILFPVLVLFWGIWMLFEKDEKEIMLYGVGGGNPWRDAHITLLFS